MGVGRLVESNYATRGLSPNNGAEVLFDGIAMCASKDNDGIMILNRASLISLGIE